MSQHDFIDVIMGQVDARITRVEDYKRPHRDFRARIQLSAVAALRRAARDRNMSVSAYLRRAGLAFAAYDQGLDLAELLEDEPPTRLRSERPQDTRSEGGKGHGRWVIRGLD